MTLESVRTMATLIFLHKNWDHHKKDSHGDDDADNRWTPEATKRWVNGTENTDGSHGAHFPMEKVEEVHRQQRLLWSGGWL